MSRDLADTLGHAFRDPQLLETALSHSSYAHEQDGTRGNERLEFLGDAALDIVIAHRLYDQYPAWSEGELTRARAALVNQGALADRARALDLGRFVKLGRTEQRSGGEDKDSVLANCFEALIGALFLDGGLAAVEAFVDRAFGRDMTAHAAAARRRDAKTAFQEWAHARLGATPSYVTVEDTGTENDESRFTVEVRIGDDAWGRGVGRSKRLAERAAASVALARSDEEAADGPEASPTGDRG